MTDTAKPYLDERVIYVFIRQDVEVKHQLVQALHAMRVATNEYVFGVCNEVVAAGYSARHCGIPFLTTVGMPDAKGLDKVIAKLKANAIAHTAFHDTDYQFGVIGVVTEPLPLSVREKPNGLLCNYRLWNPANSTGEDDPFVAYLIGVMDGKAGKSQVRHNALREIFAADVSDVLEQLSEGAPIFGKHRQTLLLAIAELSLSRPGWESMLRDIAKEYQGEDMFDSFRLTSDRIRPAGDEGAPA